MIQYLVDYNSGEHMLVRADDPEHAVEQVLDAEPDAVIDGVYVKMPVIRSAWIAAASNNEDNV